VAQRRRPAQLDSVSAADVLAAFEDGRAPAGPRSSAAAPRHLELRQRFLSGDIKGEELAQALRRAELTLRREHLQREIEIARRQLEELRGLVEAGMAPLLDLRRAEVELLEREAELQRIRRELEKVSAVRR
jgi:hypothetical protein